MTDPFDGLRPCRPLLPPPFRRVVARGRRRLQRQVVLGGVASLAGVVLGVSLLAGGHREDALEQVAASPTAPSSSATSVGLSSPVPTSGAESPRPGGATAQGSPSAPPVGPASPTPRATPRPAEQGVTRTYDGGATVQVGGRMCTTRVGVGGPSGQTQWCGWVSVGERDGRNRVPVQVRACLDQTYAVSYPLTFARDREADFAVVREGGAQLWRWSSGRAAPRSAPHQLTTDPGRCWTWATTWRAVDAKGRALSGTFVLRGWVYASEVERYLPFEQRFTR